MALNIFGRGGEPEELPIPRVGQTRPHPDLDVGSDQSGFLLQTHAQYVSLRNNEDSLIATRLVALLVVTSFLTVAWVSAGSAGEGLFAIRLFLVFLGMVLTQSIGYMIKVAAVSANTWRDLALDVERDLYAANERDDKGHPSGPYGQKLLWDEFYPPNTKSNALKRFVFWRLKLGRPNNIIGYVIPWTIQAFWFVALGITLWSKFN